MPRIELDRDVVGAVRHARQADMARSPITRHSSPGPTADPRGLHIVSQRLDSDGIAAGQRNRPSHPRERVLANVLATLQRAAQRSRRPRGRAPSPRATSPQWTARRRCIIFDAGHRPPPREWAVAMFWVYGGAIVPLAGDEAAHRMIHLRLRVIVRPPIRDGRNDQNRPRTVH